MCCTCSSWLFPGLSWRRNGRKRCKLSWLLQISISLWSAKQDSTHYQWSTQWLRRRRTTHRLLEGPSSLPQPGQVRRPLWRLWGRIWWVEQVSVACWSALSRESSREPTWLPYVSFLPVLYEIRRHTYEVGCKVASKLNAIRSVDGISRCCRRTKCWIESAIAWY